MNNKKGGGNANFLCSAMCASARVRGRGEQKLAAHAVFSEPERREPREFDWVLYFFWRQVSESTIWPLLSLVYVSRASDSGVLNFIRFESCRVVLFFRRQWRRKELGWIVKSLNVCWPIMMIRPTDNPTAVSILRSLMTRSFLPPNLFEGSDFGVLLC